MLVSEAVEILWKAGYRANASTVSPGRVVVLDPVLVLGRDLMMKREFKRVELHTSQVRRFINERA